MKSPWTARFLAACYFEGHVRQLTYHTWLPTALKRWNRPWNLGLQQHLHSSCITELADTLKNSGRNWPRTRKTLADPKYAWLAAQLHPTKNEPGLRLNEIGTGSKQRLWWRCQGCPDCGRVHEWEARVQARSGTGGKLPQQCPSCAGRGTGSGARPCFCRSVASDAHLRSEWCSEGNGDVLPETVAQWSNKKRVWRCLCNPSHPAYQATPAKRSGEGTGCPECAKEASRTKTERGLLIEEHPEVAAQWDHERNDRTFKSITSGSGYMASWICPESTCEHPHQWKAKVYQRTGMKRRTGCPFCSGRVCCPCNSVACMYPELLAEWDSVKNDAEGLHAKQVSPGSKLLVWWKNSERGLWQQKPKERVAILEYSRRIGKEGPQSAAGMLGKR